MKRVFSMLLVLSILAAMILTVSLTASAESLYIRKIVSVVYDDSGSMKGDKTAYANYAVQAFCGMLNSEDQLYITYMNNGGSGKVDLSADKIQSSINTIKNHVSTGGTPFSAVQSAFNTLKDVDDSNPNTQYWLVVITDGVFDEFQNKLTEEEGRQYLNEKFAGYTDQVMPNGTKPQITFMSIGDSVVTPDDNPGKGIYNYHAENAADISRAMNEMADRISGRTRLSASDMKKLDDRTIQVSSSIPLLNIAVFAQGSQATITQALADGNENIPVSRSAQLGYPNYAALTGGAYLLGDSQTVIGAGTYNITFDQTVNLDDVVVLFEPALEMRMAITVNGKEVTDPSRLQDTMEGDKIALSCKIYEMGTDREVDPSLLPPGTQFEVTVSENGQVVERATGENMTLSEYTLKNLDTELRAAVTITGFNPIVYTANFKPVPYVPKVVYTMEAAFGSDSKSIKLDDIGSNTDMTVYFTVFADGVAMTDPHAVKALNPVIQVSPQGNEGTVNVADDGRIIFTPTKAVTPSDHNGSFAVEVTCSIDEGVSASETYTVLIAKYEIIAADGAETVKKTGFFGNTVSASFYITKDGVKLDKAAVEKGISVLLNKEHEDLKYSVTVADDGTITVTPYILEEHKLTFWNWWVNWAYYFGLEGKDVTVSLSHSYGNASATIDVVPESLSYQLLNVYLPLVIELIALTVLTIWIILVVTKPRYVDSGIMYVAELRYNRDAGTHVMRNFSAVRLQKFNKIKRGNGRLKFKRTADVVSANGIRIRADRGGRIICEMPFPWYRGQVEPTDSDLAMLNTPAKIGEYFTNHRSLEITEFATTETVDAENERSLAPGNPKRARYTVVPDSAGGVTTIDDRKVIRSGKVFIYVNG